MVNCSTCLSHWGRRVTPGKILLASYPGQVQVAVHQVVKGTSLGVADTLRALVITTCQPKTTLQPPHESSGA
jgi:hypothetical protein